MPLSLQCLADRRAIVSHDKLNQGILDRQCIDLEDPDEVRSWATSLDVSEGQLIEAVRTAGIQVSKVRAYLELTVVKPALP